MKKRIIAMLCVLALCVAMIPSAFAVDVLSEEDTVITAAVKPEDSPNKLIGSEVIELSNGIVCDAYIYYNSITGNMTYEAVMVHENKAFSSMQIVLSMSNDEGSFRDSSYETSTTDCEFSYTASYTSKTTGNFYYWVNNSMWGRIAFTATKSSVTFTPYEYA